MKNAGMWANSESNYGVSSRRGVVVCESIGALVCDGLCLQLGRMEESCADN